MKILVSGSSGLVGSALMPVLKQNGHSVTRLVRKPAAAANEISWDPPAGKIEQDKLDGFDTVIHLAGENIASRRWNNKQKARIRDSRVDATRLLSEAIARCEHVPKSFLCASAVGIYGHRGAEELDEKSKSGGGFLADVCREWEEAAHPVCEKGIRVVHLRTGVVLSSEGGALAKMLLPFKLGLGGIVGNGQQFWSWISVDDLVGAIRHAVVSDSLAGPVNCVSPKPATNREFTKALGHVLNRPTIIPLPAFLARLMLGEMANELLLSSARALPKRLLESGYQFQHSDLEAALRHVLQK